MDLALRFTYPIYVLARETHPAAGGMIRYSCLHARATADGNRCLMLFRDLALAEDYVRSRPSPYEGWAYGIQTQLDLEFLLADLRQLGVLHVCFDCGPPFLLSDFATKLDRLSSESPGPSIGAE